MPFFYNISGAVTGGQLECSHQSTWPGIENTNLEIFPKEQNQSPLFGSSSLSAKTGIGGIFHFQSSFTFSTLFDLSQIRLCGEDHLSIPIYTSCGGERTMKSERKEAKAKSTKNLKCDKEMWKRQKIVWYLSARNGRWTAKFKSEKCKKSKQSSK